MPSASQLPQNPSLFVREIPDVYMRTNFQNLQTYFQEQNQLLDFKFLEVTFTEAKDNVKVFHGLGRIPLDIVRLQITGSGKVTFNRNLFDTNFLDISSTGAARLRFFVGTYVGSVQGATQTGTEEWQATIDDPTSLDLNVTSISRDYTVADTDQLILVSSYNASTAIVVTLPDSTARVGRVLKFKKIDNNSVAITLTALSTDTVELTTTYALSTYKQAVELVATEDNGWLVTAT